MNYCPHCRGDLNQPGWEIEYEETGFGCPSTFEGTARCGRDERKFDVYFRYGCLVINITGENRSSEPISDGLDGIIGWEEVLPRLQKLLRKAAG